MNAPQPPAPTPTDPPASGADRRSIQRERRRARHQHRRRWPRRLLVLAVVLVVLAGALVAGAWFYGRYRFDQIKKVVAPHLVKPADPSTPDQPFTMLLVGSDSRKFVQTTTQKAQFGTPTIQGGQRSDVTMVARFVPATKQIWILSIPRDLWVDIPGHGNISGPNRINAAFNTGPDLLIQTIEDDLHIPINHYASVTFKGFESMVTALGGIDMDFPDPLRDSYSGLDVTQTGCQVVDGATALALVRSRHLSYEQTGDWTYDGLSDFSRIQRQDAFFRALLAKASTIKFDPLTLNSFIGAAVKYLTIDSTFTEGYLLSLAEAFEGMPSGNLHTETLPTSSFTTTGGASVLAEVQPDDAEMIAAFNAIGTSTATTTTGGAKKAAASTTTTTTPSSSVDVEVLNAVTFTAPLASDTAATLRQDGFHVTGDANATSTGLATTELRYAPGHEAAAQAVQADLVGTTQLEVDPSLSGNQVVLTLGSSFSAVRVVPRTSTSGTSTSGTSTSGTTTSTTSSTATTSSTGSSTRTGSVSTPVQTRTGTKIPISPADVYTNTQPEPWNPSPCSTPGP